MRLIHLLADLPKNPNKWTFTNVESVSIEGENIFFNTGQEELESVKSDLKDAEKFLKDSEKEKEEAENKLDSVERELEKAQEILNSYEISPTDTIGDLVERNEWQAEQLTTYKTTCANYLDRFREMELEIENLRARKNKATIKRCVNTGKLIAVYSDKEYFLIEKN
jgi:chromosome segregation ATPase